MFAVIFICGTYIFADRWKNRKNSVPQGRTDSHEIIYPGLEQRSKKKHTLPLSSGTSPHRPYNGVHPLGTDGSVTTSHFSS